MMWVVLLAAVVLATWYVVLCYARYARCTYCTRGRWTEPRVNTMGIVYRRCATCKTEQWQLEDGDWTSPRLFGYRHYDVRCHYDARHNDT